MKTVNEIAESYFFNLNPIAERISTDIVAIQDAYEGLWNCLSFKEKNQIINETIVHPEAILKYTLSSKAFDGVNLDFPLITRQVTGAKYIIDESTGLSWRDEHSAPFSWKTPSQIDLSIFTSSNDETDSKIDNSFFTDNKNKANETLNTIGESLNNEGDLESSSGKKGEKDGKKTSSSHLSPNVVLVGTCSKLSGLCSRLKFLPGKSYSYEVQTVITNSNASNDGSFLDRIKATAVLKFQNTLKLVGKKNSSEKKTGGNKESENLVQSKGTALVVKLQKPSPKIAKPKSPPPPPPIVKSEGNEESKVGKNLIFVRNSKSDKSQRVDRESERATLLEENSVQSFLSADPDSLEQDLRGKVVHDLSDDLNSISTECTPLSGPCVDIIPKSGFDFLDNW